MVPVCGACGGDGGLSDAMIARPGTWEALPDVAGGPIQETGVAELDGRIYVVGGFDDQFGIHATVHAYTIATRTWNTVKPLPMAVHHANVVAFDGKLYVLGALVGPSFQQTGASWVYDPGDDAWFEIAPIDPEHARGSAAAGAIGGRIYLAGGLRNGAAVDDVSAYEPQTDTWYHYLAPLPAARDHLVGAALGGALHVIGGRDGGLRAYTDRVDVYEPVTDTWSPRSPLPTPRAGMAAGVVDGEIIVVGGEGSDRPSGVFDEVEGYDPISDRWTAYAPMRTPRHGMGAAGHQGALYVPGGADKQAFAAVATFEAFVPEPMPPPELAP
jgi:N-acetylneuraminic acid mutarotase